MRKTSTLLFLLALSALQLKAQDTVVMTLDASGKDAFILSCVPCGYNNSNYGNANEIAGIAWTNSGNPSNARGLFQFFFTPDVYARGVQSAKLSLFHTPTTSNVGHSTSSGSNACYLERVISPWTESTVTWDTQPATTSFNRITLAASTNNTQDYPNIDVTQLVSDMLADSANSHGFMLRLQTESYYRSLKFGSGDEPDPSNHPTLVLVLNPVSVNEHENAASFSVYPNPTEGMFTFAASHAGAQQAELKVYNVVGETVYSKQCGLSNGMTKEIIDLSGNAKGIYFVSYTADRRTSVKKIVLQ
jgi:hypothetical protein